MDEVDPSYLLDIHSDGAARPPVGARDGEKNVEATRSGPRIPAGGAGWTVLDRGLASVIVDVCVALLHVVRGERLWNARDP